VVRVFLIRHGESESNAGLPSADPGSASLTLDGHRQATQIARVLADVPALIVTSPYLRARQTAQPTISRFPAAASRERPVQEFAYLTGRQGRASTATERQPYHSPARRPEPAATLNERHLGAAPSRVIL
jgi:broad specificity phosphatase PhoE